MSTPIPNESDSSKAPGSNAEEEITSKKRRKILAPSIFAATVSVMYLWEFILGHWYKWYSKWLLAPGFISLIWWWQYEHLRIRKRLNKKRAMRRATWLAIAAALIVVALYTFVPEPDLEKPIQPQINSLVDSVKGIEAAERSRAEAEKPRHLTQAEQDAIAASIASFADTKFVVQAIMFDSEAYGYAADFSDAFVKAKVPAMLGSSSGVAPNISIAVFVNSQYAVLPPPAAALAGILKTLGKISEMGAMQDKDVPVGEVWIRIGAKPHK